MELSKTLLNELFKYEDGCLYWKVKTSTKNKVGQLVGYPGQHGYLQVTLFCKTYPVHHIIYAMHYGEWPLKIDHKDTNTSNNRIENLRVATTVENNWNQSMRCDNTTGVKGVHFQKSNGNYVARISFHGRRISVGSFSTLQEAEEAVREARIKYHGEFANHG